MAKWPPSSGARLRCSPHAPSTLATNSAAGWEAHGPGARGRREEARPRRRKRRGGGEHRGGLELALEKAGVDGAGHARGRADGVGEEAADEEELGAAEAAERFSQRCGEGGGG
eukprot:scaffold61653_cov46-Phaeocystis_antarctica.AAC.3